MITTDNALLQSAVKSVTQEATRIVVERFNGTTYTIPTPRLENVPVASVNKATDWIKKTTNEFGVETFTCDGKIVKVGKAKAIIVAEEFDPSLVYSKGDVVMSNYFMYKAKRDTRDNPATYSVNWKLITSTDAFVSKCDIIEPDIKQNVTMASQIETITMTNHKDIEKYFTGDIDIFDDECKAMMNSTRISHVSVKEEVVSVRFRARKIYDLPNGASYRNLMLNGDPTDAILHYISHSMYVMGAETTVGDITRDTELPEQKAFTFGIADADVAGIQLQIIAIKIKRS